MTFLDPSLRQTPTGLAKLLHVNWGLIALLGAIACAGFLMLYSVADGSLEPWARRQMIRFGIGVGLMLVIGLVHIRFWRSMAPVAYVAGLLLLVFVEFFGTEGKGAQRWIDIGFMQLQPSEPMKIAVVMMML